MLIRDPRPDVWEERRQDGQTASRYGKPQDSRVIGMNCCTNCARCSPAFFIVSQRVSAAGEQLKATYPREGSNDPICRHVGSTSEDVGSRRMLVGDAYWCKYSGKETR